jgi:hypothetical protein
VRRLAVALVLLAAPQPAAAHGLRLTLTAEPGCLSGQVSYSDGWPGADEVVSLSRMDKPAAALTAKADAEGRFSVPVPGGDYLAVVIGDEEHEVRRTIDVPPSSSPSPACPAEPARRAGA